MIEKSCVQIMLQKEVPQLTASCIIEKLSMQESPGLLGFALECGRLWASKEFVRGIDYKRQRYISSLLCLCLARMR